LIFTNLLIFMHLERSSPPVNPFAASDGSESPQNAV
jgi:hypothetical protein